MQPWDVSRPHISTCHELTMLLVNTGVPCDTDRQPKYVTQLLKWKLCHVFLFFFVSFIGGNPYPNIPPTEIYQHIIEGNRMERPVDCPEEMYVLWAPAPALNSIFKLLQTLLFSRWVHHHLLLPLLPPLLPCPELHWNGVYRQSFLFSLEICLSQGRSVGLFSTVIFCLFFLFDRQVLYDDRLLDGAACGPTELYRPGTEVGSRDWIQHRCHGQYLKINYANVSLYINYVPPKY